VKEEELAKWRSALAGSASSGGAAYSGADGVLALLAELRGALAAATERAGQKEAEARHLQGSCTGSSTVSYLFLQSWGKACLLRSGVPFVADLRCQSAWRPANNAAVV
jgi:hypothetical protein